MQLVQTYASDFDFRFIILTEKKIQFIFAPMQLVIQCQFKILK